ncbi:MAG: glycosyltransferase, partial [Acidimicrobiia bacterium]|nr:glycosyltransferase [Acidimicrobiia bacterium]
MAEQTRGVTAIVAAYNEAARIGRVLEVLTTFPGFVEVVVVDDGSTDGTADVASEFPVTVLRVEPNQGKGHAMDVGVQHASTEVVFFADADIVGLTHHMIAETIGPVVDGSCEMFILMRNRKIYLLHRIMAFIPLLGGERALTRDLWVMLPPRYKDRFRIEAGLNFYAVHHGSGLKFRVFKGISQTVKEAKFGFWEGMRRRRTMF